MRGTALKNHLMIGLQAVLNPDIRQTTYGILAVEEIVVLLQPINSPYVVGSTYRNRHVDWTRSASRPLIGVQHTLLGGIPSEAAAVSPRHVGFEQYRDMVNPMSYPGRSILIQFSDSQEDARPIGLNL